MSARLALFLLAASLAVSSLSGHACARSHRFQGFESAPTATDSQAHPPIRPDPQFTPGAVVTFDPAVICHPGYSRSVRHTSGKLKHQIYLKYKMEGHAGHFEVDHLIPLSLGGADSQANLWTQSYDTHPWNAHVKDLLEGKLLHLTCYSGEPLPSAKIQELQREIAQDWIAAYQKYCPTEEACPSYEASHRRRD